MNRTVASTVVRVAVATGLLVGLAAIVGKSIVPGMPTANVVLYCVAGGSIAFALIVAMAVGAPRFRQFLLRRGATDAQWLWFPGEPAGLVRLRAEERASAEPGPHPAD